MTLRTPKLLAYIDAIARLGSIRKAAEATHIASSALSRHLLDLEREIGTPLFERLPRGVRLTATGQIYLGYARRALADLEATRSQIAHLQGLMSGEVRIASAESIGTSLLPDVIGSFQEQHAGVRVHVVIGGTEMLLRALLDDEVELMLAHDPAHHIDLTRRAEIPQPLYALVRPDHPLAAKRRLSFKECLEHPYILGAESFGSRRLIDRFASMNALTLDPQLVSNSVEHMKAHARRTGAICFQFAAGATAESGPTPLVPIALADTELASGRLVLGVRRGRYLTIAATTIADRLLAALAIWPECGSPGVQGQRDSLRT
jgi:DNA-binding transcriptional LysR family regulator